jgi:hypothetical protein
VFEWRGWKKEIRMPRNLESLRCAVRWTSLAPLATLVAALVAAIPLQAQPPDAAPPAGGAYVLVLENGVTLGSSTPGESARAKALRAGPQEKLFWFRRGGKEYVLRDAATLQQIKALFEPQQKLGEQQAKLASQQAALSAKQAEQGKKQGEVGVKIAKVAAEQAHLAGLGETSAPIEAQMQELEREQEEIAKPQKELGRQQEALGRQQEDLGRQQKEAGQEAEKQLKALADQAIASGLAQEVK